MTVEILKSLPGRSIVFYWDGRIGTMLPDSIEKVKLVTPNQTPLPFVRNYAPMKLWRNLKIVRKALAGVTVDRFIVSQGTIELGLQGLLIGRLLGLRTTSYIPLCYTFREMNAALWFLRDPINTLAYQLPSDFITINAHQRKLLSFRASGKEVSIVRNPIPNDLVATRVRIAEMDAHLELLYVGRLEEAQKRISRLCILAKKIQQSRSRMRITVVGDGRDRSLLYGRPNLVLKGWLSSEEVGREIRKCDFGLIASDFEGTPLVLLEFLARGKPVIVQEAQWLESLPVQYPAELVVDFERIDPCAYFESIASRRRAIAVQLQEVVASLIEFHDRSEFLRDVKECVA